MKRSASGPRSAHTNVHGQPDPKALSSEGQQAREVKNLAVSLTAQALANPVRLQLLGVLSQAEQTVDALAAKVGQSRANTSAQLKVLAGSNLVASRREGRHVHYRLASDQVRLLLATLQNTAVAQSAELRELLHDYYELPEQLSRKQVQELAKRVRAGEIILVDLRPTDEYASGHPEGAVNVPLAELEQRLDDLPADREIVAYCRGRFCVLAVEGVRRLRQLGKSARNLGTSSHALIAHGLRSESR